VTYRDGIDAHGAASSLVQVTLYATRTGAPTHAGQPGFNIAMEIAVMRATSAAKASNGTIRFIVGKNTN
jgi:hypothetical protein